ncbi:MAG: ATP synthase F1 subunit delta [Robiginitomaculum sp.]|nr:ATP synthase F1 subunit delta [Robiginitomaculum sp.]
MSDAIAIPSEAARRYAGALLELAEDAKALKPTEKNLKALAKLFAKNDSLIDMANSPVITDADKAKTLLVLAKKAKLGKLVSNFVGLVASNGRAGELPTMVVAFEHMLAERRGTENALVTSATKLTTTQINAIKASLKKSLGHAVTLDMRIDPDLLGGFAVKIGSRYFDASLKAKLNGLKLALKEA